MVQEATVGSKNTENKCLRHLVTLINDIVTEKGSSYFQCPRACDIIQY
jgi:hypothetical protein